MICPLKELLLYLIIHSPAFFHTRSAVSSVPELVTRKGFTHTCNSNPRLCASSIAKANGSYSGSPPRVPVSSTDHGSYEDLYIASQNERTCKQTAFILPLAITSRILQRPSFCCFSFLVPGQSILKPVVNHVARNSCFGFSAYTPTERTDNKIIVKYFFMIVFIKTYFLLTLFLRDFHFHAYSPFYPTKVQQKMHKCKQNE